MSEVTIESLQADLEESQKTVSALRKESATYRVQRNAALRESHALRAITTAHNVKTDDVLTETALGVLTIEDGKVTGEFEYKAPKLKTQQQREVKQDSTKSVALTAEAIEAMSYDEINKNWDEVVAVWQSNEK